MKIYIIFSLVFSFSVCPFFCFTEEEKIKEMQEKTNNPFKNFFQVLLESNQIYPWLCIRWECNLFLKVMIGYVVVRPFVCCATDLPDLEET